MAIVVVGRQKYTEMLETLRQLHSENSSLNGLKAETKQHYSKLDALRQHLEASASIAYQVETTKAVAGQLDSDMGLAVERIDSLAASSEEINASITEINASMQDLAEEYTRLEHALAEGGQADATAQAEMETIHVQVGELKEVVSGLQRQIKEIVNVVGIITGHCGPDEPAGAQRGD